VGVDGASATFNNIAHPPPSPLVPPFCSAPRSWDRQPFLTTISSGDAAAPDYNSLHSAVEHNLLTANYGGAQGFDNDDGSS